MDYTISTNNSVDCVMVYTDNKEFSYSAELIQEDSTSRNWKIQVPDEKNIILWFLQYGNGGTANYKIKDLISQDAIIVNTPEAIKAVLIELPNGLNKKFLNLKPVRKFDEENMERYGIEKNNRGWIQYIEIPEVVKNKNAIVHCYEFEKIEIIKPKL